MALPIFGASAAVSIVNRVLFNSSPSHNVYLAQVSSAGTTASSEYAFANQLGASHAVGKTAAELAAMVLANVGISATTIPAASHATLLAAGTDYIAFHGTQNIGIIALQFGQIISSLENDATFGAAAAAWNQEVLNAHKYSNNVASSSAQTGEGFIANANIVLNVGRDNMAGSAVDDTFKADVVQNALGQWVNTLGSGDILDGGAGFDTLAARLTNGSFAGYEGSQPIQPRTNSIEYIELQAVPADMERNFIDSQVFVNAKDMLGIKTISSNYSDASLTIQNLTTKGSAQLSDLTVNMSYTSNADSLVKTDEYTVGNESDFRVLFDQDYLTPEKTLGTASIDFLAMNEDNYDASQGANPLTGVFFRTLNFTLNGQEFNLAAYLGENAAGAGNEINTYADFLAAVQKGLVALKVDFADNAALQSVTASFGREFTTDVNPVTLELRKGTAIRLTADGQTHGTANTLYVDSTDLEVARAGLATVPNNNRYEVADATPPLEGSQLGINVELEKVGRAGDGGSLVIGSMNTGANHLWDIGVDANQWNSASTTVSKTTSGINEFYVTVKGGADKSSSLSELRSTNNQLKVVTVKTDAAQTGSFANLTIGNSRTLPNISGDRVGDYLHSLKDVKIFDASAFKGDLSLKAVLTPEVIDKYMNLKEVTPAEAAADNAAFVYTGGTGNDTIDLQVNVRRTFPSPEVAENFSVNISGGAGNDSITLSRLPGDNIWYVNLALNANVRINAGEGNDIVRTPGSGNVIIDAGAGDDTVYVDNTGYKAVWVLNAVANGVEEDDIQSSVNDSYKLFKGEVAVNFKGFEATAAIADVRGVVTDLSINQAIKLAIDNDATLSKLLVAEDGPAHTLVITSLIDGAPVVPEALGISLVAPATLTAGEIAQLNTWYGVSDTSAVSNEAAVIAFNDAASATYLKQLATSSGQPIAGQISDHHSDNTITGGLGDDVLVLGSGSLNNDTLVYTGFGNGNDAIVNFIDDGAVNIQIPSSYAVATINIFPGDEFNPTHFLVFFEDSSFADTYTFDGVTITVEPGAAPMAVADAFRAQHDAFIHWTPIALDPSKYSTPGELRFIAKENGVGPSVEEDDFSVSGVEDGTDFIDFSSYGAVGVYVNGELVGGVAPTALGQKYIGLTESPTNEGAYTVEQWTDAGTAGVIDELPANAQLIAVLDFGTQRAFTADNFIL